MYTDYAALCQYRRLRFGDLAFQAVDDVFPLVLGDALVFSWSVARQDYPQYYRYRRRYSYTSHARRIFNNSVLESSKAIQGLYRK